MRLAGGLAIALAAASELAGSDMAIAVAIAGLLAFFASLIPESNHNPGWLINRVLLAEAIVNLPLVAAYSSSFAAYVVPEHSRISAAGLVLLAAYLENGGIWISSRLRAVVLTVLVFGVVVLMLASLGATPEHTRHGAAQPWSQISLAALALAAVLVPRPGPARVGRFMLGLLTATAVYLATVHQLGTDLSSTFLKDLLNAAELDSLGTALVVFVGLATVTAAIESFSDAELDVLGGGQAILVGALVTAVSAAFVPPVVLMAVAGVGMLANVAFQFHIGYETYRR